MMKIVLYMINNKNISQYVCCIAFHFELSLIRNVCDHIHRNSCSCVCSLNQNIELPYCEQFLFFVYFQFLNVKFVLLRDVHITSL
jgi:hypothetical protein